MNIVYGLFRASSGISHFGTNQSTIHTKILDLKAFCSNSTFHRSYANVHIFIKVKEALLGARC